MFRGKGFWRIAVCLVKCFLQLYTILKCEVLRCEELDGQVVAVRQQLVHNMDIYLVYILAYAFVARNITVAVIEVLYKSGIRLLIGNNLFTVEVSCLFK